MYPIKQLQTFLIWFFFSTLLLGCGGGGGGSTAPAVTLDALVLSPINSVLDVDDTLLLTVTGQYSDASSQNLSSEVIWAVDNGSIVSLASSGLLTALAAGTTTVTASLDGLSVQRSVTVRALSSLSISPGSATLAINSSQQLSVTGIYTDNSTESVDGQVSWSSANNATASVSNVGVVTAHAAGTVDITATLGAISQDVSVTVSPATLQSISVSAAVSQVAAGLSAQFSASGHYSDGTQQNLSDQVVWSVSDLSKATIEAATGLLSGQQAGSVTVTAAKEGLSGSLAFTISPASLESLQVTPTSLSLAKGTSQGVTVTAIFSDDSNQDVSDQVSWASDADSLVTVSGSSLVEALAQGSATLTANLSGVDVDLAVTVTSAELVSLSLTPVNKTIPLGVSQQYVAQGTYSDGSVQDLSAQVTWLSSNDSAVVISNNVNSKGRADTLALGSSTISAVLGEVQQGTILTVDNAQLSSIDLQPTNQTVAKGSDATIRAFGQYTDGARIDITSLVNWNTSSTGLIDLSLAANGAVKTLDQGDALVSAELEGITSLANISVTNATLASISIESASTNLADGTSLKLIARGQYSDASSQDISDQVTWQSSDISVLSVANGGNDFGTITGQSPGQANITASFGAISSQESFTVSNAVLSSLLISSPVNSLNVNASVQASAQATYTDATTQDVTNQVNWLSSQTTIASVDNTQGNKGQINALSLGDANISASLNGIQSNSLAIAVTQDANLPTALNLQVQPNIILNNGTDSSLININVIPALSSGSIADGTVVSLTITEGDTQRTENLITTNGLASYNLSSNYQGVISLSASVNDLVANSGLLSSSDFSLGIIKQGLVANIVFENNTLKAGSAFLVLARNISNRTFLVNQVRIRYLDPANGNSVVDLPDSPVTDSGSLSGGSLTAGEYTSIGYQLEADVTANIFALVYFFEDQSTGTEFPVVQSFIFGE